jgi:L-threonylcarbamoyladenylate synthase
MLDEKIWDNQNLIKALKEGGIVVMPTDTIYGIVGSALRQGTVERIYKVRNRQEDKPCIILIAGLSELEKFSIAISLEQKEAIGSFIKPTSFILDCPGEQFAYLHRGTGTLSFRIPQDKFLREMLAQTGPLIAPSANPEGMQPAQNLAQAKEYFKDQVDLYIDGGEVTGSASRVVKLHIDGSVGILRG